MNFRQEKRRKGCCLAGALCALPSHVERCLLTCTGSRSHGSFFAATVISPRLFSPFVTATIRSPYCTKESDHHVTLLIHFSSSFFLFSLSPNQRPIAKVLATSLLLSSRPASPLLPGRNETYKEDKRSHDRNSIAPVIASGKECRNAAVTTTT